MNHHEIMKKCIEKLEKTLDNSISYEILSREAISKLNYKYKTLQEALTQKIPDIYFNLIPKSYDIVGNIAVLEFARPSFIDESEFNKYKNFIAKAIIDVNKNVQSVFEKKSEIKGVHRLREFAYLSGENKSETIHRENSCCFKLDIKTTYFSPRLVNERRRIANINFQEEEVIVDMFAGVGPFSIQIAKRNIVDINNEGIIEISKEDKTSYIKDNVIIEKSTAKNYLKLIVESIDELANIYDKTSNNLAKECFRLIINDSKVKILKFSEDLNIEKIDEILPELFLLNKIKTEIEIESGLLFCDRCHRWFPIIDTIPQMLPDEYRDQEKDTNFLETNKNLLDQKFLKQDLKPFNI